MNAELVKTQANGYKIVKLTYTVTETIKVMPDSEFPDDVCYQVIHTDDIEEYERREAVLDAIE